jgi:hypothetical protein
MCPITPLAAVLLAVTPLAAQGVAGGSSLVSHGESTPPWTAQRSGAVPAAAPQEGPAPIRVGQTVSGRLGSASAALGDGSPYADHRLTVATAQRIRVTMRSAHFDAYLRVGVGGAALVSDDDGAGGTDARVEIDVPAGATVLIRANALSRGMEGAYTLQVERI